MNNFTEQYRIKQYDANELEERKMNPLANAIYDQVLREFMSGDSSCFYQTLCEIEDLNNPVVKKYMQGYLEENENE